MSGCRRQFQYNGEKSVLEEYSLPHLAALLLLERVRTGNDK